MKKHKVSKTIQEINQKIKSGDVVVVTAEESKMTWEDDGLVVPLAQCSDRGEDVEDRTIVLRRGEGDALIVLSDGQELRLTPCS